MEKSKFQCLVQSVVNKFRTKDLRIIPLIETDSTGSWNELETTNFYRDNSNSPILLSGKLKKPFPSHYIYLGRSTEKLNESSLPKFRFVSAIQNYPVLEKESLLSILQ